MYQNGATVVLPHFLEYVDANPPQTIQHDRRRRRVIDFVRCLDEFRQSEVLGKAQGFSSHGVTPSLAGATHRTADQGQRSFFQHLKLGTTIGLQKEFQCSFAGRLSYRVPLMKIGDYPAIRQQVFDLRIVK
jgi:hypothetical protein